MNSQPERIVGLRRRWVTMLSAQADPPKGHPFSGCEFIRRIPMATPPTQRALQETFQSTILSWAQSGALRLVFADPRRAAPVGVEVKAKKIAARALSGFSSASQRFSPTDTRWPELGLHSFPYPFLLCVLEGEADIRIGLTRENAKTKTARKAGVYIYSLPAQSCLLIPPGTPYDDGSTPHWERAHPESARSQILWLQILPTGTLAYTCSTEGATHAHNSALFIPDAQLSTMMQFMVEKATHSTPDETLLRAYLATILLSINANWKTGRVAQSDETHAARASTNSSHAASTGSGQSLALERARRYIQSHLVDTLSPAQIARHAYVSEAQLKRIFRAHLDLPVMKYVAARRLDEAQTLLLETDISIAEIGVICGYPHRTHFSRAFKSHAGLCPQEFRRSSK